MRKLVPVLIAGVLPLVAVAGIAGAEIKLGVVAPRGELQALTRWNEFGAYMTTEIGRPVKIVPIRPAAFLSAVESGEVDLALANPIQTVVIQEKLGGTPLASLNTDAGTQFAGIIITRKESGITKAPDLRGKTVMALNCKTAAAACIFQAYHLKQKGIDVHRDLVLKEVKTQDDIVLAVKAGIADAGFIRTGQLGAMEKEGKIRVDDFVIVDRRADNGFSEAHTTALYPEWYLCATSKVRADVAAKAKAAALKLGSTAPASKAANIKGFVEPLPMGELKVTLKALKIAPYDR